MKVSAFALAVGLFAAFGARADDVPVYPIDVWHDKAMSHTNGSTYAMIDVEGKTYEKWDAELNIVYQRLLHKLDAQDQAKLKEAQRRWVAWRDSESTFSNGFWLSASGGQMGTLDRLAAISEGVETVRGRVIKLMGYEEDLAHPP